MLWIIGIPSAPLWGVLAAVMRFVPYVGSFAAAAFPIALAAMIFAGSASAQLNCPGTDNSIGQASLPITVLPYQLQSNDQCLLKLFNSPSAGVVRIPPVSPGSSFPVSFANLGAGTVTLQPLPNAQGITPLINMNPTLPLATGQAAALSLGPDGNWYASAPTATSFSGGTVANAITAPSFTSNVGTGTAPFTVSSTTVVPNLNTGNAGNGGASGTASGGAGAGSAVNGFTAGTGGQGGAAQVCLEEHF